MRKPALLLLLVLCLCGYCAGSRPASDGPARPGPAAAVVPAQPPPSPVAPPAPKPARVTLYLVCSASCPWCERLKQSLEDPAVAALVADRFDLQAVVGDAALEARYGVQYYPTLIALTAGGAKVKPGYMPPAELLAWLRSLLPADQAVRRRPGPPAQPMPTAAGIVEAGPGGPGGREVMVDMPADFWRENIESRKQGCCVFRSLDHSSHWQNVAALFGFPEWLQKKGLPGGGWSGNVTERVAAIARERGLPEPMVFQYEGGKDATVLELALATGRMPAVDYSGADGVHYDKPIAHVVNLVYLDQEWACILDSNFPPDKLLWLPRAEFLKRWGGWAIVLLAPRPPAPPCN